MKIILASGSPRRKEILEKTDVKFTVVTSDKEEHINFTDPQKVVHELSEMKALDVFEKVSKAETEDFAVIGADTVVSSDGMILGKPKDRDDAVRMIEHLSGRVHQVFTGVTIVISDGGAVKKVSFEECTDVHVVPMTRIEVERYVDTGEAMDKAGAYAIQGRFAPYIEEISGDYYNIVGFPISRIMRELKKNNIVLA